MHSRLGKESIVDCPSVPSAQEPLSQNGSTNRRRNHHKNAISRARLAGAAVRTLGDIDIVVYLGLLS
jgi:hypothetical protein